MNSYLKKEKKIAERERKSETKREEVYTRKNNTALQSRGTTHTHTHQQENVRSKKKKKEQRGREKERRKRSEREREKKKKKKKKKKNKRKTRMKKNTRAKKKRAQRRNKVPKKYTHTTQCGEPSSLVPRSAPEDDCTHHAERQCVDERDRLSSTPHVETH
jgi:hypothetical protein